MHFPDTAPANDRGHKRDADQTDRRCVVTKSGLYFGKITSRRYLALAQRRYVIRHRLFRIFLACFSFHRVGGPQFSGMILGVDFGGSTPVLF